MKNLSLQDQLLKAGLTTEAKVKQTKSEKRKQSKQQRKNNVAVVDEAKQQAIENKARQAEKDRLLNEQRKLQAEQQQIANQVKQLIDSNKLPLAEGDDGIAYHFNDAGKVKTLYIDSEIRNKIISGKLAIVKQGQQYDVVPASVAEKIRDRDEHAVALLFSADNEVQVDDVYKGYEVPDDLMW
jgi:uncharacterized protein